MLPSALRSPSSTDPAPPPPADAAPSPNWYLGRRFNDIDEQASAQPQWRLQYEQLSMGRFEGEVQMVQLPGLRMIHESSNRAMRQCGQLGPHDVGFAMGAQLASPGFFHGQRLDTESILVGRGDELDLTTPDDHVLMAVTVDGDLLATLWEQLYQRPWASWLDHKVVVQARPAMAAAVQHTHLTLLQRIAAEPGLLQDAKVVMQLRDAILIEWIEAIPARVDTSDLASISARRRLVERACELVLSRPTEAPTILQVCREIGVSPRKLAYCFNDVLGISPSKYLRAVRLNGVRRELKAEAPAGRRVHDLAARWGFWHMGAFSADYKRQFGEPPSATARAAQLRCAA